MNAVAIQQITEHIPPHSVGSEQATLGSLLLNAKAWAPVSACVAADDFYRQDHRLIFSAIASLACAGRSHDVVMVSQHLEQAGELDRAGGLAYLSKIARETPSAESAAEYAGRVRELSNQRRLLSLGPLIKQFVAEGADSLQIAQSLKPVLDTFSELAAAPTKPASPAIDWSTLRGSPPERTWWLPDWLGPDPTLTSGAGGAGKSRLWQALGTSLATGRPYLGPVLQPLRVLIWSCEEDRNEIWRVQTDINRYLDLTMDDLGGFHIVPRRGLENTLFELVMGKPMLTPTYTKELYQQVNDLKIDVFVGDNIAQLYGGNENDRHQATMFVNSIAGLVRDRPFCPVLLGHVARSQGSEFSGSAAWENAVRMRWYLGSTLPDQKPEEDEPADPGVVYLAKRKSNYTAKDWRRLRFQEGVLVPEEPEGRRFDQGYRDENSESVVLAAMPKLIAAGLMPTDSPQGSDYLPAQIVAKGYGQGHTKKELAAAMNRLMGAGRLKRGKVGTYSNRSPRMGLVLV